MAAGTGSCDALSHHQDLDTVSARLDTLSMARLLSRHWIRDRVAEEASWC